MSRRTIVSLAASVIIGIACIATVSTDAFAYRAGEGRAGIHHGGVHHAVAVRRGVGAGVATAGAAAVGAYHAPRCGFLPLPPCY
jgi:hypothetical protein